MTDAFIVSEPVTAEPPRISINYRPKPGLGALVLKNIFLNFVTLFIYSFWAKTNVRKHIWSCVHIMDEPLEYTGRGIELALGFLIVIGFFLLPLVALQTAFQIFAVNEFIIFGVNLLILIVFTFLTGVAIYRARRYRLSRTLWRGIRGTLIGSAFTYGAVRFGFLLLQSASAMWTHPVAQVTLFSILTGDMRFGNRPFKFQGNSGPLYGPFAIFWFGTLVAIILIIIGIVVTASTGVFDGLIDVTGEEDIDVMAGVIATAALIAVIFLLAIPYIILRAFYTAAEISYLARGTRYEDVTFAMNATTGSLVKLVFLNGIIMLFTLGLAAPFVQQNLIRYLCERLSASGELDLASIQQSQAEMDQTGEGLAEVFDVDVF